MKKILVLILLCFGCVINAQTTKNVDAENGST